jgi:hypothetical protein
MQTPDENLLSLWRIVVSAEEEQKLETVEK